MSSTKPINLIINGFKKKSKLRWYKGKELLEKCDCQRILKLNDVLLKEFDGHLFSVGFLYYCKNCDLYIIKIINREKALVGKGHRGTKENLNHNNYSGGP